MQKKIHALLIALVLALALALPAGVLAATPSQIVNEGGTVYYDANGNSVSESNAVVSMSKTIEATGVENEFIVTLNVKTKQKLLEISGDTPDAAVLLVMDVSNSMDDCVHCGQENGSNVHGYTVTDACPGSNGSQTFAKQTNQGGYNPGFPGTSGSDKCRHCGYTRSQHEDVKMNGTCTYQSRLAVTQASALEFLNQFASQTGAQGNDQRMVAIVAYGTHAHTELDWVNIRTQDGMDKAVDAIEALTIANSGRATGSGRGSESLQGGGTSIESGLALGRNLLQSGKASEGALDGIDYLYTIMLTDGQPTYGTAEATATRTTYIKGSTSTSGSSTEESDYNDVAGIASSIKNVSALSKLYSICIGKVASGNTTTQVWNQTLYGSTTVGSWLSSFSTEAYHGDDANAAKLFETFNSVLSQIQLATKAWKVEDWMGDHMVFEGAVAVHNGSGTLNNHVTYALSASDYANGNAPAFLWDLLASQYDSSSTYNESSKTGELSYTYKYKVRLCNLDTSYTAGEAVDANEKATLRYVAANQDGTWPTDYQTKPFPVPEVKGLSDDITFQKLGKDSLPMAGMKFRLRLNYDPDCEGSTQPHFQYAEATADENGMVTFRNIPSGHTYTLLEDSVPADYLDPGDHTVTVAWGDAEITKPDGSLLTDSGSDGVVEFYNTPIAKDPGQITLQKTFAEGSVKPASIAFTIVSTDGMYNAQRSLYPIDAVTIDGQEVWQWTLGGLDPDRTYTVTEYNALDANGHQLRADHNLSYTVSVDGQQKLNNTFVEGDDSTLPRVTVTVGEGKTVTVRFHNNMTRKVGTLRLLKDFKGLNGTVPSGMTMTVTATEVQANGAPVANARSYTIPMFYNSEAGTYTASQELPVGYYKLEETITGLVTGYTHEHYAFTQHGAELNGNIVQIVEGTQANAMLTLINHYKLDVGRIRVHKLFAGEDVSEAFKDKDIEVGIFQNGELLETLVLNEDSEWAATSGLLPVGNYQLIERRSTVELEDYVYDVTWDPHDTVTVDRDATVAVHVTNTYTKEEKFGQVTITKKFTGLGSNTAIPEDLRIIVYAKQLDTDGSEVYPPVHYQFQLEKQNGYSVTRELPAGSYALVEEVVGGTIAGYVQTGAEFTVNSAVLADDVLTVAENAEVVIELNNLYTEEDLAATLTIPVTKKVALSSSYLPGKQTFTFTFTMTGSKAESLMVNIGGVDEMMHLNQEHTFTIETNGAGEYTENIVIHGLESELNGLSVELREVASAANEDWVYDTAEWLVVSSKNASTGELTAKFMSDDPDTRNPEKVTFVNTYTGSSQTPVTVKIPFSKTVVQTGTADPGVNTFYFEYFASEEATISVLNDPLNRYGKVSTVKDEYGNSMIAVTVNGANTVSGTLELKATRGSLPLYVGIRETNGLNYELDEKTLQAAGWQYDITAFPYKYEEVEGEMAGFVHVWWADVFCDADGKENITICRSDDLDSVKSEIAFVNTYSANLPVADPPKTGDDSNIALWIALMGMSVAGIALVVKRRKTC